MGLDSTSLRVTYNVSVDSESYARVRMTHLFLHNARARTAVKH